MVAGDSDTLDLKPTHDILMIAVGSVIYVDKPNEPFSHYSLGCGASFHLGEEEKGVASPNGVRIHNGNSMLSFESATSR